MRKYLIHFFTLVICTIILSSRVQSKTKEEGKVFSRSDQSSVSKIYDKLVTTETKKLMHLLQLNTISFLLKSSAAVRYVHWSKKSYFRCFVLDLFISMFYVFYFVFLFFLFRYFLNIKIGISSQIVNVSTSKKNYVGFFRKEKTKQSEFIRILQNRNKYCLRLK